MCAYKIFVQINGKLVYQGHEEKIIEHLPLL